MTNEQYETELAELLNRKATNKREAQELDDKLMNLRFRRHNPTFEELLNTVSVASVFSSEDAESQSAFAKRD